MTLFTRDSDADQQPVNEANGQLWEYLINTIITGKTKRLEFMQINQPLLKTSQEAPA